MTREIARAISKGDIDKFDMLIQNGLDINTTTEQEKWNFLHRALLSVSIPPESKMIQHLVDCGINVNAVDCYGNTPLHYAARLKIPALLQILLDGGAKVNVENLDGVTPLREALLAKPYNLEALDLLLSRDADMRHRIQGGITVREYAEKIAHGDDIQILDVFSKYA